MRKKAKIFLLLAAFLGLGAVFAITQNAQATTSQSGTATILTTVLDTLSMSCANASIPTLTAGLAQSVQAACTVTINGASGFNLKVHKTTSASDAAKTLVHSDNSTWIADALTPYNETAGSTATWSAGTTKGLGFRVQVTGTTNANTVTDWGADGSAKYAAFPTVDKTIYNYASYVSTASAVNIDYKLDVPSAQKAGTYTGTVLYTATTN